MRGLTSSLVIRAYLVNGGLFFFFTKPTNEPIIEPTTNQTITLIIVKVLSDGKTNPKYLINKAIGHQVPNITSTSPQPKVLLPEVIKSHEESNKISVTVTPPPITPPLSQYGQCFQDFIQDIIPQQNRAAVLFKNTRLQYTFQLMRTFYYALCF